MDAHLLLTLLLDDVFFVIGAYYIVNLALLERSKSTARMAIAGALLLLAANVLDSAADYISATHSIQPDFFAQIELYLAALGALAMLVTAGMIALGRGSYASAAILPSSIARSLAIFVTACQAGAYAAFSLLAWRKGKHAAGILFLLAILAGLFSGDLAKTNLANNLGLSTSLSSIVPWANLAEQVFFAIASALLYYGFRRSREAELNRYLEGVYS
jgi:hypothetical protein